VSIIDMVALIFFFVVCSGSSGRRGQSAAGIQLDNYTQRNAQFEDGGDEMTEKVSY
jgi:hypothetical protein